MPAAYSMDLRRRVLQAYLNREGTFKQLSERFDLSYDTVRRLIHQYNKTGSIQPMPHGGGKPFQIQGSKERFITQLTKAEPNLTLSRICYRYYLAFGEELSSSTLHDTLKRLHIIRKKKSLYNIKNTGYRIEKRRHIDVAHHRVENVHHRIKIRRTGGHVGSISAIAK